MSKKSLSEKQNGKPSKKIKTEGESVVTTLEMNLLEDSSVGGQVVRPHLLPGTDKPIQQTDRPVGVLFVHRPVGVLFVH